MITINEIMTSNLYTLMPDHTIQEAHDSMKEKGIRHIPIINRVNHLVGLVTQRDILAATSPQRDRQLEEMSAPISSIMSGRVDTIPPSISLIKAALFMRSKRRGCLPVVERGELLGIVTDTDFVTIAIHLLEQLEAVEPLELTERDEDFDYRARHTKSMTITN